MPTATDTIYVPIQSPLLAFAFAPLTRLSYAWAFGVWALIIAALYAWSCRAMWTACAGLHAYRREVLASQEVRAFKPAPRTYHWACDRVDSAPDRTALLTAHSWDVHGAMRAGLVGAFATRAEGRVPDVTVRYPVDPAKATQAVGLMPVPLPLEANDFPRREN